MEALRKALLKFAGNSAVMEKNWPILREAALRALPLATTLCQKLDAAIEKMKPLGGS
jgi:hypothetical protein